jgi:DNA relaxase NicK
MQYDTLLDYLTVSFRCKAEWKRAVGEIEKFCPLNLTKRPWYFNGYSGYSQSGADGHLAYGSGREGGIVQSSGDISDLLCREHSRWVGDKVRFTRLDLALTFTLNKPLPLVREASKNLHDDWSVVLRSQDVGGGTLYVGNRKSDSFGRLYDKGAELNQRLPADDQILPEYLWRAELEVKRGRAREMWSAVNRKRQENALREFTADTVLTWFSRRGVYLPVLPTSSSVVSVAHRGADDVRTLKWLHEQVRPAIWRLAENGKETEVARALSVQPQNFALDAPRYLEENYFQFNYFDQLS